MNKLTLSQQQQQFSKDISQLIAYIYKQGYACTFSDAYRPPELAELYAKEGKGIVDSLHCKRLAVDLNIFNPEGVYITDAKEYEIFGVFWESIDSQNRWGGRFKRVDLDHFERREIV